MSETGYYKALSGSSILNSMKLEPFVRLKINPTWYYVIHTGTTQIVGAYMSQELCSILANSLNKKDQEKLSQEMENVLIDETID